MEQFFGNLTYYLGGVLIASTFMIYYFLKSAAVTTSQKVTFSFLLIIVTALIPFVIALTLIFAIYRQIIHLILTIKHGSKFGGLLAGRDAIYFMEEYRKEAASILVIIEFNRNNSQNFYDFFKSAIYEIVTIKLNQNSKIFGHLCRFLGYSYILKDEATMEDCIGKLNTVKNPTEPIDRDDLLKIMSECNNKPLPHNHKVLWEVLIGTQPVRWNKIQNDNRVYYPVSFRFNHVIGDGATMVKNLFTLIMDPNCISNVERHLKKKFKDHCKGGTNLNAWRNVKFYLKQLYHVGMCSLKMLIHLSLFRDKSNFLHGSRLSHERLYAVQVDESAAYVQKIKKIKSQIPGCTFMDVILTAVSSSLSEYFEQKSTQIPKYITIAVPELLLAADVSHTTSARLKDINIICQNNLTFTAVKLPIFTNNCKEYSTSVIDRLLQVKKQGSFFRNPAELKVNYFLMNAFFQYFPKPLAQLALEMMQVTAIISNIPGFPPATVLGGYTIQDILPFSPHRENTGVSILIFTYNKRLQLSLAVDKVLISDEGEVQNILTGIYKYLDLLDDAINVGHTTDN